MQSQIDLDFDTYSNILQSSLALVNTYCLFWVCVWYNLIYSQLNYFNAEFVIMIYRLGLQQRILVIAHLKPFMNISL